MKFSSAFVFLVFFSTLLLGCEHKNTTTTSKEKPYIKFKKEGVLRLKKAASDSILKTIAIEIAASDYETQTGLMYRNTLGKDQGMLFIFPDAQLRNFYMKYTKIALDIIFIDANRTIVSFQKDTEPLNEGSLPSKLPAKYVLEINAGLSDEWQLNVGDRIDFDILK